MNRKDFLRRTLISGGVLSAWFLKCNEGGDSSGSNLGALAALQSSSCTQEGNSSPSCVIVPQETEGPYPMDLSANSAYFRSDITESKSGLPLLLELTIVNVNDNCSPIANARVDVWHCDKDGYYSGYDGQSGYLGTKYLAGETFCRGIQLSDTTGSVSFSTIYPGWYPGRVTHIHFQVYLNNGLIATSQIAFPEDITKIVYSGDLYKAHGQNTSVSGNCGDSIFAQGNGDLAKELCTIVENASSGGYIASLLVGIAV